MWLFSPELLVLSMNVCWKQLKVFLTGIMNHFFQRPQQCVTQIYLIPRHEIKKTLSHASTHTHMVIGSYPVSIRTCCPCKDMCRLYNIPAQRLKKREKQMKFHSQSTLPRIYRDCPPRASVLPVSISYICIEPDVIAHEAV